MLKSITAVALSYNSTMEAPHVTTVAKGVFVEEILKLSRTHGIPVRNNPNITEKLEKLPLQTAIPESLYEEVAKIFLSISNLSLDD